LKIKSKLPKVGHLRTQNQFVQYIESIYNSIINKNILTSIGVRSRWARGGCRGACRRQRAARGTVARLGRHGGHELRLAVVGLAEGGARQAVVRGVVARLQTLSRASRAAMVAGAGREVLCRADRAARARSQVRGRATVVGASSHGSGGGRRSRGLRSQTRGRAAAFDRLPKA